MYLIERGVRVGRVRMAKRGWITSIWKWEAFLASTAPHQLAC